MYTNLEQKQETLMPDIYDCLKDIKFYNAGMRNKSTMSGSRFIVCRAIAGSTGEKYEV